MKTLYYIVEPNGAVSASMLESTSALLSDASAHGMVFRTEDRAQAWAASMRTIQHLRRLSNLSMLDFDWVAEPYWWEPGRVAFIDDYTVVLPSVTYAWQPTRNTCGAGRPLIGFPFCSATDCRAAISLVGTSELNRLWETWFAQGAENDSRP